MRFSTFTLENYGPFRQCALALDAAPGRITLLLAPNGQGKSVIRRAFGEFLFGIHERSPMSFLYGTQNMRLSGEIDGARLVTRRKGRGNTLSDANGAIDEGAWRRLTGTADTALFDQLFALDTTLLREGGASLLRSDGRLGQILFAGGGGLARVNRVLDELTGRRDAIGRAERRDQGRPLWTAATAFRTAKSDLEQVALKPEGWLALERRVVDAQALLDGLRPERAAALAAQGRLQLARAVRPRLAARRAALERLAWLGDVPSLDEGFETAWRAALAAHREAASVAATRAAQAAEQDAAAGAAWPDDPVLELAERIEALGRTQGKAAGAAEDLPARAGQLEAAQADIARLCGELGRTAEDAMPPAPAVRGARQILGRRGEIVAQAEAAAREAAMAERHLAEALAVDRAETDATPGPELRAAADVLAELRADGEPGRRHQAARVRVREAEAALASALAAIPDRVMSAESLGRTAAPSGPTLMAAEAALSAAQTAAATARAKQAQISQAVDASADELAGLMRAESLPEPDALAAARAERDRLWSEVHRLLLAPEPAAAGAAALAFDRALRWADGVADTVVARSAGLAQAAALRGRIAALAPQHAAAGREAADAETALVLALDGLAALARAAGSAGQVPQAALRAFLAARESAVDRHGALRQAMAEAAALEAWLTHLGGRLAEALGRDVPALSHLAGLMGEADRAIEMARAAAAAAQERVRRLDELRRERDARREAAAARQAAFDSWEAQWRRAAEPLGRPDGESVEASAAALDLIEDVRARRIQEAEEARRTGEMRAEIERFAAAVAALAARLAPELACAAPADALAALTRRLTEARALAAAAAERQQARTQARDASQAAATAAEATARLLAGRRDVLRAADDGEAETMLKAAREAAAQRDVLAAAESELRQLGDGMAFDALSALVAQTPAETSETDLLALSERLETLNTAAQDAAAELRSADEARTQQAAMMDATTAAARRESARARLAEQAEQGLLLHAAVSLLNAGLKRQRGASESAMARRIGAVFAGLTCGAHAGVAIEESERVARLVVLEGDGIGRKQIDELSEGTRDQLYLALRIVALEDYAAVAPALPFIADDVLQTFDDARTRASLEALIGLSAHVQVIALTHHPHVAALAADLPVRVVTLPA